MKQLIQTIYLWCKSHSTIAHIIGASILALSYCGFNIIANELISIICSFVFSSVFFIGKEIKDKSTTGFDLMDLLIDYVTWTIITILIKFLI